MTSDPRSVGRARRPHRAVRDVRPRLRLAEDSEPYRPVGRARCPHRAVRDVRPRVRLAEDSEPYHPLLRGQTDYSMKPQIATRGLLAAIVLVTVVLHSADTNSPPSPSQPTKSSAHPPDAEAQAETFARYAMPGPEHKVLDRLAGTWDTRTRYWPAPEAEPVEAKGTSQRKWILGGRFLMEELDGGNLVLPFHGVALFGYDAFERKHTSAWVDTMNTSILTNLGTYDRTNEVVNFTGQYKDPWTGTKKEERGLTRFLSKDKHVLEIHVTEADGKEFKMLEITYTRRLAPAK